HLPSRADRRRAAMGTEQDVARAEPDPQCVEVQDADAAVGGGEGLPRAAEQHARELERAAADEGAEPAARVAQRQPLDQRRRRQPALLRGSARLARAVAGARRATLDAVA